MHFCEWENCRKLGMVESRWPVTNPGDLVAWPWSITGQIINALHIDGSIYCLVKAGGESKSMHALVVSFQVYALVFAGALVGIAIRRAAPANHFVTGGERYSKACHWS
jgi:hypothetical protein